MALRITGTVSRFREGMTKPKEGSKRKPVPYQSFRITGATISGRKMTTTVVAFGDRVKDTGVTGNDTTAHVFGAIGRTPNGAPILRVLGPFLLHTPDISDDPEFADRP